MIDGLKPYPKYKESGVPWLGQVPEHWEVRRLKYLFREIDDRSETGNEELLSVSHLTGVTPRSEKNVTMFLAESNVGHKVCAPGDVVVNTMWAWMAALGVARQRGMVSPSYAVYRPRHDQQFDPTFVDRLIRTEPLRAEYVRRSTGINSSRMRLYPEQFLTIPIPFPPNSEQQAMGCFLAHVDRQVGRYIRAKKKLIALLNEQKQAIIHHAVTRGLDLNVRMKSSGVEWLGEVPEHWTVKRFKFVASVATGQIDPRRQEIRDLILIAPNHITSGTGRITRLETASAQGAESGKYEVRKGNIVYSKIRPALRKAVIAPLDCICSADMYPISVQPELRTQFALLLLLSQPFTRYAVDCSLRVAMPKLNREALGSAWLWYPSVYEQDAILEVVNQATEPFDAAIEATYRAVNLIREIRMRLIADVVSGRLDVRRAAARIQAMEGADELEEAGDTEGEIDDQSDQHPNTVEIEE